jgi:hypothetical protein
MPVTGGKDEEAPVESAELTGVAPEEANGLARPVF